MTAEIINLKQARKAKAKADKEKLAQAHRAKFGRTKAEKLKSKADESLSQRRLDGHVLVLPVRKASDSDAG
jgi:hypothetical protein